MQDLILPAENSSLSIKPTPQLTLRFYNLPLKHCKFHNILTIHRPYSSDPYTLSSTLIWRLTWYNLRWHGAHFPVQLCSFQVIHPKCICLPIDHNVGRI